MYGISSTDVRYQADEANFYLTVFSKSWSRLRLEERTSSVITLALEAFFTI